MNDPRANRFVRLFVGLLRAQRKVFLVGAALAALGLLATVPELFLEVDPYQPFGQGFETSALWIPVTIGIIWMVLILPATNYMSALELSEAEIVLTGLACGAGLCAAWLGVHLLLPAANAVLDFRPPRPVPIRVHDVQRIVSKKHGGERTMRLEARVARLDHPQETITIKDWPRVHLPEKENPSPLGTVWIGSGALGVPWISRVERRPRAIDDDPLFPNYVAGRGTPLMLILLPTTRKPSAAEKARRQAVLAALREVARTGRDTDETWSALPEDLRVHVRLMSGLGLPPALRKVQAARVAETFVDQGGDKERQTAVNRWVQTMEAVSPRTTVAVAWSWRADASFPIPCQRCRVLDAYDLHKDVLNMLIGDDDQFGDAGRVHLIDGQGKQQATADILSTQQLEPLVRSFATTSETAPRP